MLALLLSVALATPAPLGPCTLAGTTLVRQGSVWTFEAPSFDARSFDLSDHAQRFAFEDAWLPCASEDTWSRYVSWRTWRLRARTTAWTAVAMSPYAGLAAWVGGVAVGEAIGVVPSHKRRFEQGLQADLLLPATPLTAAPGQVALDRAELEHRRKRRQVRRPLIVGGVVVTLGAMTVIALATGGGFVSLTP